MGRYDKFSRNSRRLQGYDYKSEGLYFLTICTYERLPFFWYVKDGEMILSKEGQVVQVFWREIPDHHPQAFLGEFILMPNHIHGIIELAAAPVASLHCNDVVEVPACLNFKNKFMSGISPKSGSISRIMNSYKSACTNHIRKNITPDFSWQPRFHDHIIRNQQELQNIGNYILSKPEKWTKDCFYR